MYLQGRATEISARRNDTKQVRDVCGAQCVVAHLPPTVILLPASTLMQAELSSALVQSMNFKCYRCLFLDGGVFSLSSRRVRALRAEILAHWRTVGAEKHHAAGFSASALSTKACWRGDVAPRYISNPKVCRSQ